MVYNYVSTEETIQSFLRRTRLTDATYSDDLLEWLRDGVGFFRVKKALEPTYKVIEIKGNKGKLPCGITLLDGIIYNGHRLRKGGSTVDARVSNFNTIAPVINTYFTTDVNSEAWTVNEQNYQLLRGADIVQASLSPPSEFYIPYPRYIQTSFETGCVLLLYRKMPVDDRGYPMIPDEANCKFALFWWLMASIALTGYKHNDARHDYSFCMNEFEKFFDEGRRKIKTLSTDDKEAIKNMSVNLIPPAGWYENFGVGSERSNGFT